MKRIIVVCEGETERTFCSEFLEDYLSTYSIAIQTPLIKKTKGGLASWASLKAQIEGHLRQEKNAFITTMIDFYGIESRHGFPQWEEFKEIPEKYDRLTAIENAMKDDISCGYQNRFIPYLQLHEFEALVFTDKEMIIKNCKDFLALDTSELDDVFQIYSNPELINDGKDTSPSHRLSRIILGYDKILHGCCIVDDIGIDKIRAKAPHFNDWISKLISI